MKKALKYLGVGWLILLHLTVLLLAGYKLLLYVAENAYPPSSAYNLLIRNDTDKPLVVHASMLFDHPKLAEDTQPQVLILRAKEEKEIAMVNAGSETLFIIGAEKLESVEYRKGYDVILHREPSKKVCVKVFRDNLYFLNGTAKDRIVVSFSDSDFEDLERYLDDFPEKTLLTGATDTYYRKY